MNQVPLLIACFSLEGCNICKIASVPLTLQVSMCLTTCIKIVHSLSCELEAGGKDSIPPAIASISTYAPVPFIPA